MLKIQQKVDALQGLLDIEMPPAPEPVTYWPAIIVAIALFGVTIAVWRRRRFLRRYWDWQAAWRAYGRHRDETLLAAQLIKLYRCADHTTRDSDPEDDTLLQRLYAVHYGHRKDHRLGELKSSLRELILYD